MQASSDVKEGGSFPRPLLDPEEKEATGGNTAEGADGTVDHLLTESTAAWIRFRAP